MLIVLTLIWKRYCAACRLLLANSMSGNKSGKGIHFLWGIIIQHSFWM